MLLVIHNLPFDIAYNDIKLLLSVRCGIREMILDKLVKEGNHSRSVTVGVANDEEANIIMRNINGYSLNGKQIHVEDLRKKNKPVASSQRPDVYVDDQQQYRSSRSDHYGNDQQQYRPSRQEQYSNDQYGSARSDHYNKQQQFRSPAAVRNPFAPSMSRPNQATIPSLMSFTGPAFDNMGTSSRSQNISMDYGNRQRSQHSPQFGSNQGGQHAVWNEGGAQYGHPNPKEDVGPGPSRYGDDRREPSRDSGHDRFPVEDRKRRRSPDRGYYEDRRPADDNNYRESGNYVRQEFSEKYDPEDTFRDDFTSTEVRHDFRGENLRDQRGFPKFQPDSTESFRGGEFSNSGERYPKIEGSPYGSHASGLPSTPYDNRHMDRDDKRNSRPLNSRWNETPQQAYKTDRNTQKSNSRWNEIPQQAFKTDRNTPKSNSRWNESPSQTFRIERNSQNSNSRRNETPHQSYKTERDVPPPKTYKGNDSVQKGGSRFAADPPSVYNAVTSRNEAAEAIARKILRARLHYKMNNFRYQNGLNTMKHIIKVQLEELIRLAYPGDILAVVPVEEMLVMYKRKFTKEDDDELFAKTFVIKEKANSLGLQRKIAKSSPAPFVKPQKGPRFTPNAPGARPSFTPNKPNKPFMPRTPNQNSSVMQHPKNAGTGVIATSAVQLNKPANQARPGKLPQYIDGDKKKTMTQKQITRLEFFEDDFYKCDPALEKAVDLELDDICKQYELGCETSIEEEKQDAQLIREKYMPEFRKTMRLHMVKRLLNIGTNLVARIFAHGKPPKRIDVELALKPHGVTTLKKSKTSKLMYVATCDSFENYDKLCSCEGIPLMIQGEETILVAKPFHLTMPHKFRRQLNKMKRKHADAQGIPLDDDNFDCDDLDENFTDDVDDDVQVIEAKGENVKINDSIVVDDASDDVVEVIEKKIDAKTLGKDAVESKIESKVSTADVTKPQAVNTPTTKLAVNPLATKPQAIKTEAVNTQAGKSQAGKPQAGKPQAGKPQAVNPQAGKPQAVNPQAGKPQAVNPQAAKPQSGKPQAVNPQAGKPQAVNPIAAKPQAVKPQAVDAQAAKPQAVNPQAGKPQAVNAPAAKLAINPIAVKAQAGKPENGNKGLPKQVSVDEVGDVDVDEIAFDEDDLEDY